MTIRRLCLIAALSAFLLGSHALAQDEDGKLNLNTATEAQLSQIPGIKPEIARNIIEKRKSTGEFVDIEELLDVDGVDGNLVRQIRDRVYVKQSECNC